MNSEWAQERCIIRGNSQYGTNLKTSMSFNSWQEKNNVQKGNNMDRQQKGQATTQAGSNRAGAQ